MLLFSLPLLLCLLALLFGSLKLAMRMQRQIALKARLDICATQIAAIEAGTMRELSLANRRLDLVEKTIVALRIGSLIADALGGGLAAELGEAGLKKAADALALWQDALIVKMRARLLMSLRCSPSRHSESTAMCSFSEPRLAREGALSPDLPGLMRWKNPSTDIRCFGLAGIRPFETRMRVNGDADLMKENHEIIYEKPGLHSHRMLPLLPSFAPSPL